MPTFKRDAELSGEERQAITRLSALDARNTARLKAILGEHGWPRRSLVGDDGGHAAWLLAQHADTDPTSQRRCLELMQAAAFDGEADRRELAYLTDRVLLAEGVTIF